MLFVIRILFEALVLQRHPPTNPTMMSETENKPVSIGEWIVTFIILGIPLLNVIMLIVWALGATTHPSKKSYAQAILIIFGVLVLMGIVVGLAVPGVLHLYK